MSEKNAFAFIQHLRQTPALANQLDYQLTTLADLVEMGQQIGLSFTPDDLRQAFKQEWGERWLIANDAQKGRRL